jgi:hypothetical protein
MDWIQLMGNCLAAFRLMRGTWSPFPEEALLSSFSTAYSILVYRRLIVLRFE